MRVSVIIVNYNVKYFLEVCLHSVYRALSGIEGEVIVVDNHSSDGSVAFLKQQFPQVRLIENNENTGFSKANNQGVAVARGTYILFLNPDTVLPEDFFSQLLSYMDGHPDAGAIGPRLIDGKGQFAPDAKKSFPSFSVALFKGTGINRLFPRSSFFNRYYAVHIGEHELASVEVLSGCCMIVRRSVIGLLGDAFDEQFFMYFEDGDLCYRIHQAGYKNIYYPHTTVIHYKGESTRKATISYVRIFNEALSLFVRKHYSRKNARLFILLIHIGIAFKSLLGILKIVLKKIRMPLLDAMILFITLWIVKDVYIIQMRDQREIPAENLFLTLPVYTLIWVISLYLNGAYDQAYRAFRILRGMIVGTILCLAYFILLPPEVRYSRALIIFSGAIGSLMVVILHELFSRSGIWMPMEGRPERLRKAVIISGKAEYGQTLEILKKVPSAPDILGRMGYTREDADPLLGDIADLKPTLAATGVEEVIFCMQGFSYKEMILQMETAGPSYDYKIHLPGSSSFVGSNSSHTSGDLYTADIRYNLSGTASLRNKRLLDLLLSCIFILLYPFLVFAVRKPAGLLKNCWRVWRGKNTWVGYASEHPEQVYLPLIRPGIFPPWQITEGFRPGKELSLVMDQRYALTYSAAADFNIVIKNFRFSGENWQKDFVET